MRSSLLRILAASSFAAVASQGTVAVAQPVSFARSDISTGLSLAGPVVVNDFNGDAILDLLVSNRAPAEGVGPHLLLGNGDGTFAPPRLVFLTFPADGLGAGDLNGDGRIDILLAVGELWVLLGDGTGTFQQLVRSSGTPTPRSPVVADFNGDGTPDVAVASQFGGVAISLGNGDGSFRPSTSFPITGGFMATALAAGDFDGNGTLDLAATNVGAPPGFEGSTVSVLLGRGDGTFGAPADFEVGTTPMGVVTTDFNHDGTLDLAVIPRSPSAISVLLGVGDGTFTGATTYATAQSEAIATVDLNGDSHDDLAVCGPPAVLSVLTGDGNGGFGPRQDFEDATDCVSIAPGDFNRDGRQDLAVNYFGGSGIVSIFLNGGGAPDTTPPTVTASAAPSILWPPNGQTIPVLVTGSVSDAGSGVAPSTGRFHVTDEYGGLDVAGPVPIAADGTYSVQVPLVASRRGNDRDGRRYVIAISAADHAGNTGSASTIVTVPHSAPPPPPRPMLHIGAGHPYSWAEAINNRGQVVGVMNSAEDEARFHAFVWQDGVLRDLHPSGGSHAVDINDHGLIVGNADFGDGLLDPVVWEGGAAVRLEKPTGAYCGPTAVNEHGLIAGYCAGPTEHVLVFWRGGVLERLALPPNVYYAVPEDLNDRGVVVGLAQRGDGRRFPFVWQHGRLTDLNTISDRPFDVVVGINERGQIAGEGPGPDGRRLGLLWEGGRTTVIPPLPGHTRAFPQALNDRGQLVGVGGACGFLWTDGRTQPLACFPGGSSAYATAINERGDVAGLALTAPDSVLPNAVLWPGVGKQPAGRTDRDTASPAGDRTRR
jgi:probable HAF family extracellular repeat protein